MSVSNSYPVGFKSDFGAVKKLRRLKRLPQNEDDLKNEDELKNYTTLNWNKVRRKFVFADTQLLPTI